MGLTNTGLSHWSLSLLAKAGLNKPYKWGCKERLAPTVNGWANGKYGPTKLV